MSQHGLGWLSEVFSFHKWGVSPSQVLCGCGLQVFQGHIFLV